MNQLKRHLTQAFAGLLMITGLATTTAANAQHEDGYDQTAELITGLAIGAVAGYAILQAADNYQDVHYAHNRHKRRHHHRHHRHHRGCGHYYDRRHHVYREYYHHRNRHHRHHDYDRHRGHRNHGRHHHKDRGHHHKHGVYRIREERRGHHGDSRRVTVTHF